MLKFVIFTWENMEKFKEALNTFAKHCKLQHEVKVVKPALCGQHLRCFRRKCSVT